MVDHIRVDMRLILDCSREGEGGGGGERDVHHFLPQLSSFSTHLYMYHGRGLERLYNGSRYAAKTNSEYVRKQTNRQTAELTVGPSSPASGMASDRVSDSREGAVVATASPALARRTASKQLQFEFFMAA